MGYVLAATPPAGLDASTLLLDKVSDLGTESALIIGAAVTLGFAIFAVRRGVGWAKSFTK